MRPLWVVPPLSVCAVTAPCFYVWLCVGAHRRVRPSLVVGGGARLWVCARCHQQQSVAVGVVARAVQGPCPPRRGFRCVMRWSNPWQRHWLPVYFCVCVGAFVCLCFVYIRSSACFCVCVCVVPFSASHCVRLHFVLSFPPSPFAGVPRPLTPIAVRGVCVGRHLATWTTPVTTAFGYKHPPRGGTPPPRRDASPSPRPSVVGLYLSQRDHSTRCRLGRTQRWKRDGGATLRTTQATAVSRAWRRGFGGTFARPRRACPPPPNPPVHPTVLGLARVAATTRPPLPGRTHPPPTPASHRVTPLAGRPHRRRVHGRCRQPHQPAAPPPPRRRQRRRVDPLPSRPSRPRPADRTRAGPVADTPRRSPPPLVLAPRGATAGAPHRR